jgi:protein subunit release factor B
MSGPPPQDERDGHITKEAAMTTLFINPEIVQAEVEARRERLTRDWQQHPRAARRSHRRQFTIHLPVRAHRHA